MKIYERQFAKKKREYLAFKNPTPQEFQELEDFVRNEIGDYLIRFIIDEKPKFSMCGLGI
ncbi:MAG TPA: hypothetical protein ENI23_06955 [bacterium]|nr:hypothetical protein [bacterium]